MLMDPPGGGPVNMRSRCRDQLDLNQQARAGDLLEFPAGKYTARADAVQGAECVWVWELPVGFRKDPGGDVDGDEVN